MIGPPVSMGGGWGVGLVLAYLQTGISRILFGFACLYFEVLVTDALFVG